MKDIIAVISLFLLITTGCTDINNKNSLSFKLNQEEMNIYEQKGEFDESMLLNLDPISVAKLYVYASYNNEYELVYNLYTKREGFVVWSKDEDQRITKEDRGSNEQIANTFRNIENGMFYYQSDDEGYIEYEPEPGNKSSFQLIKNSENEIWKVSFMPIQ